MCVLCVCVVSVWLEASDENNIKNKYIYIDIYIESK